MRITKEKAELVAKKLTEKKVEKCKNLQNKLAEYVTEIAKSKVPKPVMDMYKEYPKYTKSKEYSICIQGEGIDNYRLSSQGITEKIPYTGEDVSVNKKQSDKIQKLHYKIEDAKKEIKQLQREIETAVYNLRTYNKCEKEFPEAFKHLPKEAITTALSVNISDIRNKLNS